MRRDEALVTNDEDENLLLDLWRRLHKDTRYSLTYLLSAQVVSITVGVAIAKVFWR